MTNSQASAVAPEIRLVSHSQNGGLPSIAMLSISSTGQISADHPASMAIEAASLGAGFEQKA